MVLSLLIREYETKENVEMFVLIVRKFCSQGNFPENNMFAKLDLVNPKCLSNFDLNKIICFKFLANNNLLLFLVTYILTF